ncbi:NUDIX hydrolase [Deinococcus sp. Marseille-Q6407]|uniref:NUDIX hydrolase n=1 Tax=Deinococcus sp. Marseille-Q6407 TaxID=2969223 RepID=UPI0021BF97D2|nr:NUDIX hydrolase [Deinococcus sp. Marseille-Q6407]
MSDDTPVTRSSRSGRRRRSGRRSAGAAGPGQPQQIQDQGQPGEGGQAAAPAALTTENRPQSGEAATRTPRRRSRSRRGGKAKKVGNNIQYPGQVTNDTSVPKPAPPSRRGKRKRPLAAPRIGVGCVILRGDQILLVRERGRWSLPKGGLEAGELIQDGARRETYEETGLVIELRDLAFVVEFQAESWGHHLQFFYTGRVVGGDLGPRDPDHDVQEARFVPVRELREYIRFRPRLVSLETWLHERRPRHFVFNLDQEPAMLRRRRRVGADGATPAPSNEPQDVDLD